MEKSAARRKLVLCLMLVMFGVLLIPQNSPARPARKRHLLFFTLSAGFKHGSIPTAVRVITAVGNKSGEFDTTESQDVSVFTKPETL
jgi:hypothetical protein